MIKNYILDTNVLIHYPGAIHKFQDNHLIIPLVCLEELDNLKKKEGLIGYQAREAIREINSVREYGNIHHGVPLPNGGTLKVEMNQMNPIDMPDGVDLNKNDNKIIIVAANIKKNSPDMNTILVTKDICVALKAEALNLEVQDYENDRVDVDHIYKGYRDIMLPSNLIDQIFQGGLELNDLTGFDLAPHEFFSIKSSDNKPHEVLAKFDGNKIIPLKYDSNKAWGLTPRNREQKMAFELLMDDQINLVTLSGGAGTGKSILSVAVALQKVIEQNSYDKIILVKPVVSAGDSIGYLPGTENEKLRPFMESFGDAIESLVTDKTKKKWEETKKEKPAFSVENFLAEY